MITLCTCVGAWMAQAVWAPDVSRLTTPSKGQYHLILQECP